MQCPHCNKFIPPGMTTRIRAACASYGHLADEFWANCYPLRKGGAILIESRLGNHSRIGSGVAVLTETGDFTPRHNELVGDLRAALYGNQLLAALAEVGGPPHA